MKDKKSKRIILSFCILIFAFCIIAVGRVNAAELFLEAKNQEVALRGQFIVNVFLNATEESINAVEGRVFSPEDLLEVKEIRDGNSIINFWIERPKVEQSGIIGFSGIIPGGYTGKEGLIFSIIFQSKNEGEGEIKIQGGKVLLNDGKGTPASLSISNFKFLISEKVSIPQISIPEIKDTDPPEDFKPEIAQSPEMFDGKYFLVFTTQDKGSGIDHYEILEKEQCGSLRGLIKKEKWQVAESPYLLKDQNLRSYIFVKAIDKAGNERVETLPAQKPFVWYKNYLILVIITLGVIIFYLIWKILWKRHLHLK